MAAAKRRATPESAGSLSVPSVSCRFVYVSTIRYQLPCGSREVTAWLEGSQSGPSDASRCRMSPASSLAVNWARVRRSEEFSLRIPAEHSQCD